LSDRIPEFVDEPEVAASIDAGLEWLDNAQYQQGYWAGMLESNCCMEAEWIMSFHVLGYEYPHLHRLVRGILSKQRRDGSWETYFDAPSGDINTTVEAYVALRIAGVAADTDAMSHARAWILDHGGLGKVRVFTRYWLALIGEWPWQETPNLPPEIIRLPRWMPFNIYRFSSWARATLVPLAVLSAARFTRPLPAPLRPRELFPDGRDNFDFKLPRRGRGLSLESVFRLLDRFLHGLQRSGITPGRKTSVELCLAWILRHQDADGAWGGIQPPWIYSLMALHASGFAIDHPVMKRGLQALDEHWSYEWRGCRFIQASESPVWDTLLAALAMQECGRSLDDTPALQAAVDWLLVRENRTRGDWSQMTPSAEPGGWAFERANRHYPDIDDTAVAILVLSRFRSSVRGDELAGPLQRAIAWVTAMQSRNGGWGAFDRDNQTRIITRIPFCDFGEVLDPPSADVTAHVVEAFAAAGIGRDTTVMRRAVDYLWSEQEPAGCWFGRWGVNYIYGTAAVLPALRAAGENLGAARARLAVEWLLERQNDDGGWGETCASYMDLSLAGRGESTASQTAWAMLALLAVDTPACHRPLDRAAEYLLATQAGGTWNERHYTGTGFPGSGFGERLEPGSARSTERFMQGPELARAFMINYGLYRHYFPLIALGRLHGRLARA